METMEEILAQAHRETGRIAEMQRRLERMEVTGRSRNNGVSAKLRGTGQVTEVTIDPRVLARYDAKAVGGFVVEAVNDAMRRLGEASQAAYAPFIAEAKAFVESFEQQVGP